MFCILNPYKPSFFLLYSISMRSHVSMTKYVFIMMASQQKNDLSKTLFTGPGKIKVYFLNNDLLFQTLVKK
jgi:hypothetical protein